MRDDPFEERRFTRYVRVIVPILAFVLIGGGIWYLLHDPSAMRREAPPLPTLMATLPPPPPPPPKPKEKPPEPEKKIEQVQKTTPTPKQLDAPKPLTESGPAQAGGDQYGIGQGEGGGDVAGGAGLGAESYGRYLTSLVQTAVQQDERVNHLAFNVQVVAWVDANRRLHIRLLQSSGDPKIDSVLAGLADSLPAVDEEPPGAEQFRLAIHSKRPA